MRHMDREVEYPECATLEELEKASAWNSMINELENNEAFEELNRGVVMAFPDGIPMLDTVAMLRES